MKIKPFFSLLASACMLCLSGCYTKTKDTSTVDIPGYYRHFDQTSIHPMGLPAKGPSPEAPAVPNSIHQVTPYVYPSAPPVYQAPPVQNQQLYKLVPVGSSGGGQPGQPITYQAVPVEPQQFASYPQPQPVVYQQAAYPQPMVYAQPAQPSLVSRLLADVSLSFVFGNNHGNYGRQPNYPQYRQPVYYQPRPVVVVRRGY